MFVSRVTIQLISPSTLHKTLRKQLKSVTHIELRDMIYSLLTPSEQDELGIPIQLINKVDFLGYMQRKERLNEVEEYLGEEL